MKTCTKCGIEKPLEEFTNRKSTVEGKYSQCTSCQSAYKTQWKKDNADKHRNGVLMRLYGITLSDYNNFLEAQDDSCAVCKTHKDNVPKNLHVDHCHETGKVRGLLCNHCNLMLGYAFDSVDTLKNAIEYLEGK